MMKRALLRQRDIDADHFWSKVDRRGPNDCWLWQAYCDKDGYGYFTVNKAARKAHRVAYVLTHGNLEPSQDVCHACDTPGCVNPAHLWVGTYRDNIDDMLAKGRSLRGATNPKAKLTRDKCNECEH